MNITEKKSVIKLCVPLIYEKKYLYNLISLNDAYSNDACFIYEAYGSLREDIIGNLRPSYAIKDISISRLKDYISILHSYNIRFDYIINSTISPMPMEPQIKASDILNFIYELSPPEKVKIDDCFAYNTLTIKYWFWWKPLFKVDSFLIVSLEKRYFCHRFWISH